MTRHTTARTVVATALVSVLAASCSGPSTTSPEGSPSVPSQALTPVSSSCHPGVGGAENWIIDGPELAAANSAGASVVQHAVSAEHLLVLLHGGGQTASAGQGVEDFRSYAVFKKAIKDGSIPASVRWVMYDNEQWKLTPANEQADPVHYEQLFAKLAHSHGYDVILAPAQDLVPGFSPATFRAGNSPAWQSYLSMGLATASGKYGDIYDIQAQPYEIAPYRTQNDFEQFVAAAAAQARAANPNIVVYAGLSTLRVTNVSQLLQDYMATRDLVDGYWLNIPRYSSSGAAGVADRFLHDLPAGVSADAADCGGS